MERQKKITIQDVARHANVSVGTIDRVIHNRGKVSPAKREKVERAIRKLNFNPNLLARTLALGHNFTIAVLIPRAPSPGHYWSMPAYGIDIAGSQYKDYGISVEYFFYDLFDEASYIQKGCDLTVIDPDAVVLAPLFFKESRSFLEKLKRKDIPFLFIDADIPDSQSLAYIGPDVKRSAYIAGKLLNSVLPCQGDVLIVNMVKGFANASALQRMEAGFRDFFQKKGRDCPRTIYNLTVNATQKEIVFRELTKLYIKHPHIKGVFVTNSNAFTVAEFHQIHDLDIRIVGYDLVKKNIEHLRTGGIDFIISQSPVQQGRRAIKSLFEFFVFKKEPEKTQYVPLDIIIPENLDFYVDFYQQQPQKAIKQE